MTSKPEKLFATLIRGKDYHLSGRNGDKDTLFLQGQPVEITPEQHDWLRLHAVDRITVLDPDTDELLPLNGGYDNAERRVAKDVQKFRFTTEAAQAA